ncbi:HBS1-like protein isoform X2 [Selaginella moellendorffii]|uniref:HBS1-like protein isoform X2 n=1 Tax=Selaginella moellendorffii TaxID=88036 RepID=UPI000D1C7213|nr:HBS1-like protein isoform X2 [Selaginella moellendorffii]|eukprot:XP_024525914.1 HBS1-like protein isoform X2 [Selaginella moellendorffii]
MPRKGSRQSYYDDSYDDYYDDYEEEDYADSSSASAPGTAPQQPIWACPICTYDNLEEHQSCEMCGVVRDSPAPIHASGSVRSARPRAEPSQLATSLFAPLPPLALKKGITSESIKQTFQSRSDRDLVSSSSSPIDDAILGAVQGSKKPVQGNSHARAKSKAAAPTSDSPGNQSKLSDKEHGVSEKLKKSLVLDGDSEDVKESSKQRLQSTSNKGLPLESYKPEPWMMHQGSKTAEKSLLNLVVVGHVDAGKSTLMGRILHSLGRVSQKEMHKNTKEANEMGKGSFAYAWALDEGVEERARGVTITVAVAHFETAKLRVVLLDAPGHKDFVPNMISGASQADAAVLVVDAAEGGFEAGMGAEGRESGQTREHAQLVRSLGVSQLVVAVNKMDEVQYSQERFEEIKRILTPFLRHCGFRDSSVSYVPVSAIAGENLVSTPSDDLFRAWYTGKDGTLLDALNRLEPPERDIAKPFRLAVAEVVRSRSLGSAAAGGKVESGAIKIGSKVMVMPSREVGVVKNLEQDGKALQTARAGDGVDIGLQGVDAGVIVPGGVLCHPDYPVPIATRFELRILTLKLAFPMLPGAQVVVHAHHAKEPGTVTNLTALIDAKTGQAVKRSPRCLTSNQSALVEVAPERGLCVQEYIKFRGLGRVVLRSEGRTLAVGIITRIISYQ